MIELTYPRISFWNEKAKQIKFINEDDFQRGKLLKAIGLNCNPLASSFGVVNGQEIRKRQTLVKFFVENSNMVAFLEEIDRTRICLPTSEQNFIDYFLSGNDHCPFCELVNEFVDKFLELERIPSEIFSLAKFLENTTEKMEAVEKEMIDAISSEVKKASYIEGTISFRIDHSGHVKYDEGEDEVYGYQKYIPGASRKTIPEWLKKRSGKIASIAEKIVNVHDKRARRRLYSSHLIKEVPPNIRFAIQDYAIEKLRNLYRESNLRGDLSHSNGLFFKFFFRYSFNGLEIRIIDVDIKADSEEKNEANDIFEENFDGYTRKQMRKIRTRNQQFVRKVTRLEKSLCLVRTIEAMNKKFPRIFHELVGIKSPEADLEFRWCLVKDLYTTKFKESFSLLSKYRNYFHSCLNVLTNIAKLAQVFVKRSETWNKPLCFPRIMGNKAHLVSFESLDPVHLIGEVDSDKLVSIVSLPSLNGQAIGFTGQNAGGKSVAEESIANAVYLAQSGLPVFGKGFALNPKRRIGFIFMERGKGSTAELLLIKGKRILEELQKDDKNGTLLIIDEIGSATQHLDGTDYGRRFLKKLSESGCSILFSTQISEVAEYAQKELGAQCFTFDLKHRITPGIGKGGLGKLMDRMGMTELLEASNSN